MGIVRPGHLQGEFNAAAAVDAVVEMYGDAAEHGEYLPCLHGLPAAGLRALPGLVCPAILRRRSGSGLTIVKRKTGTNVEAGRKRARQLDRRQGRAPWRRDDGRMPALPRYILLRLEAP